MAKGTVLFSASVRGARDRPGQRLSGHGGRIQRDLNAAFVAFTPTALRTTRLFAPHHSGRLERDLDARIRGYGGRITVTIYSNARSDTGFDYLPITRFGHRVAFIFPRRARALKFFPKIDTAGTGKPIWRRFVRGYHPSRDWVDDAYRQLDHDMDRLEAELGRKLDRSLAE